MFSEWRKREAAADQAAPDTVVCVSPRRQPCVIQLVDVVAAVSVMSYEEPVIDLVQGHTTGSPHAVGSPPAVGDTTDKCGITPYIVGAERVARWNTRSLSKRGPCGNTHQHSD